MRIEHHVNPTSVAIAEQHALPGFPAIGSPEDSSLVVGAERMTECCDECKTYLKIFYLEKKTSMVVAAAELASLALDMLVDQEGYNRIGPNLLFLPGTGSDGC